MQIESVRHKALQVFAETGRTEGLPGGSVERLLDMLAYLDAAGWVEELRAPPNFGAHLLTGDQAGTWSLSVTRNWRLTFRVDEAGTVEDLDLEDYH